jgi:hypothetical protein
MLDELAAADRPVRVDQIQQALAVFHVLLAEGREPGSPGWLADLDVIGIPEHFDRVSVASARDVLRALRDGAGHDRRDSVKSALLQGLSSVVEALRPGSPAPATALSEVRRFSSECAGVLLLVAPMVRFGWAERILDTQFGVGYGPRAVTYLLAGIGLAACGRFSASVERLDSAIALLAGWIDQPHLGGLREMLASDRMDLRADLLRALVRDSYSDEDARTWASTFGRLAVVLIRDFTSRIRGFTQATPEFITREVLATSGRVTLDDTHIVVALTASPLHVALHMSSADEAVDGVWWLGSRRIDYELEGL